MILINLMVLYSWKANFSATLVQPHPYTISRLLSSVEVRLCDSLKVLCALSILWWSSMTEALVYWVRQFIPRITACVVQMRINICCSMTWWAILSVNHEVIVLSWLQLELGVGLWRL